MNLVARMSRLRIAGFICAGVGLWLIARPYKGIRHDGILYLGQALQQLFPGILSDDIFFRYGSQASFTLFPQLLAAFIRLFGVGNGHLALFGLGLVAFWLAAWFVLRHYLSNKDLWFGAVMLACFPHFYSSEQIFAFAEPFLTPRLLAEACALAALGLVVIKRYLFALLPIAIGMSLHPLLVLPVLLVIFCFLVVEDRRWWWAALAVIPVLVLAQLKVPPFNALFEVYDKEWFDAIVGPNKNVFVRGWDAFAVVRLLTDLTIAGMAWHYAGAELRRLLLATAVATLLSVAITAVGADLLHSVLVSQIQIWRTQWILHFLALAFFPFLMFQVLRQRNVHLLSGLLLAVSLMATQWIGAAASTGFALVLWLLRDRIPPLSKSTFWFVAGVCVLAIATQAVRQALATFPLRNADLPLLWSYAVVLLSIPAIGFGLGLLFWKAQQCAGDFAVVGFGVALLAASLTSFDARDPYSREMETGLAVEHPFKQFIPPHSQVYWQGLGPSATWSLLQRPSFFSPGQSAGLLFSRGTALEFVRRDKEFAGAEFGRTICKMLNSMNNTADSCAISPALAVELCHNFSDLDFLITEGRMDDMPSLSSWRTTESNESLEYFLYACQQIRS